MPHDRNMSGQRAWPVRYRVTIRPERGEPREFFVVTWLGPEKAVVMATHRDGRGYGTADGIYDVTVDELGPAPRNEDGTVAVDGDLHDRMEF